MYNWYQMMDQLQPDCWEIHQYVGKYTYIITSNYAVLSYEL